MGHQILSTANEPPFDENEPRIILPTPGRDVAPSPEDVLDNTAVPEVQQLSVADILNGFRFGDSDLPVIISEAGPLLNLTHALRSNDAAPDLGALQTETIAAVRRYESKLSAAGIIPLEARAAHYIICATLDDVIRNRPWGHGWGVDGLVSTFHHDVTGGDKVFELLAKFQETPAANRNLLLLIYLCLSLGFEGRTRVSARGELGLTQIRENLYRVLRTQFGAVERDLSPNWQGEAASHQPIRSGRLFWLILGCAILALSGLFITFNVLLGRATDDTLQRMATLPPGIAPSLFVPEPEPVVEPTPPNPDAALPVPPTPEEVVPEVPPIETFLEFLRPEIEEGIVQAFREDDAVLVRVTNSGAFGTGSARIEDEFLPVFDRIGQALSGEDFDVTILGHTDDVAIRRAPYPSNFHLSKARAEAVGRIIANYMAAGKVDTRGEADSRPIASNDTPEGREQNRRTELLVRGAGDAVPPDLLDQTPTGDGDAL